MRWLSPQWWNYESQNSNHIRCYRLRRFHFFIDLGICSHATWDSDAEHFAFRDAVVNTNFVSSQAWGCSVIRKTLLPISLLGVILLLPILACGGSASAPEPTPASAIAIPTQEVPEIPASPGPTAEPAIPERRLLVLEFPPKIRAGDSDIVRLTLEMDDAGNITPTAVVNGNVINGQTIEIPNLYETQHVVVEASFDIAGVQVAPPGTSSQTLSPGQSVMFFWSIRPQAVGTYRGTVWLFLRFVDKVSQEESRRAVSAQMVEIEAVNLFGVPAGVVRTVGGVGSVVGAVVGFPFFEDIIKFLFKKRKKQNR
jgi:hypothetical protein